MKKIKNIDLIVCGEKSIDGETGQVAYGIGERKNFVTISNIDEIKNISLKEVYAKQIINGKERLVKFNQPAVLIFREFCMNYSKINLIELKKARRKEIIVWNEEDLECSIEKCGFNGSKTKVLDVNSVLKYKQNILIDGNIDEKTIKLWEIISK